MNLIQIQDNLKQLPNSPQVMQLLANYANGMNPQVPPYLALGELNRRKQIMQQAQAEQAGQPPQGTVKDQIEQQAGVMALQAGRQQQAMQNAVQMGAQQPQQVPPQATAQGTVSAAGGGLLSLLADRKASGGIVAFQSAGSVEDQIRAQLDENDSAEDDDDDDTGGEDEDQVTPKNVPTDARSALTLLQAMALKRQSEAAPKYVSPLAEEAELIKKYPERFAVLNQPVGAEAMKRMEALQAAQMAELQKRREEAAAAKPSIFEQMGDAAMRSRGQYGKSALATILGGYGQQARADEARALKEEQALRMQELEMQQVKNQALDKIDEINRARAQGDIDRERKAKADFARLMKDHNVSINSVLGRQLAAAASLAGAETRAAATVKAAEEQAKAKRYAADKPKPMTATQQTEGQIALVAKNIMRRNPGTHPDDAREQAIKEIMAARQQAQFAGVTQRSRADAEKAVNRASMFNDATWTRAVKEAGGDEAKAKELYIQEYLSGRAPEPASGPVGGAPAAAPAAPARTQIPVTVQGRTFYFPTQEAADKFKAAAGAK